MLGWIRCLVLALVALALTWPGAEGLGFGKKKQEEEEKKFTGKQSFDMGLSGLQQAMRDPDMMRELARMYKDPEALKEAQELMKDPQFKKEMEKLANSDQMKKAFKRAEEIANDPEKMAAFQRDIESAMLYAQQQQQRPKTGKDSAQIGLQALTQTIKDPSVMADVMNMMKDPETMKEVEALMKDPAFQAEMKRITSSPTFKAAMQHAAEVTEQITKDPKKMKEFMGQMESVMGSLRSEL